MKIPPPPKPEQQPTVPGLFTTVTDKPADRAGIYGAGGIGKTTLGCQAPGDVAYLDSEDSLPVLKKKLIQSGTPLPQVVPVKDWENLRRILGMPGWGSIKSIVVELTRVEYWAALHTIKTIPHEKTGVKINRIEDYGYGKGYQHIFETFEFLLADFDRHVAEGRNIILIMHECTRNVPNPRGGDFLRYEPRLQSNTVSRNGWII